MITPGGYGPGYPAQVPAYGTQYGQVGYQQPYLTQGGPGYQVYPQPVSYGQSPICY